MRGRLQYQVIDVLNGSVSGLKSSRRQACLSAVVILDYVVGGQTGAYHRQGVSRLYRIVLRRLQGRALLD